MLALAIIISLVTGISSASLVALISQRLSSQEPLSFVFIGYFMVLVLVVLVLELVAKWLLIRLTALPQWHANQRTKPRSVPSAFFVGLFRLLSFRATARSRDEKTDAYTT